MTAYQLFPEDNILTKDAAKPCTSCGVVYPLSHYHKNARAKDGREHRCPKCRNKGGLVDSDGARRLRESLGIEQVPIGTPCEICGKSDLRLHFDHCHKTNKHRGWLCAKCNTALGALGDDVESIMNGAIRYLRKFEDAQ